MNAPRWGRAIAWAAFIAGLSAVVALDRSSPRVNGPAAANDPGFALDDVAHAVGIDFVHHGPTLDPRLDHVAPHVAGMGASVSVTDVNNDGRPDLYFTNSRFAQSNALYLNQPDGTFRDVAPEAGVAALNREGEGVSTGAVWGDYDNDGFEDLLVYKWGYPQLLRNLGHLRFEDVTEASGLRHWMNSNSAIWLDVDRDGLLDIYLGAYFRSEVDMWRLTTTRIMHNSFEFATNGGKNLLYRNLGGGKFQDVTDIMGVGSTRWTLAVASADFNDDGWPDLYLANDYGPEELFLNREGKRFELTRAGLSDDSKSGMSASLGDVLNRGRLDVFVTNISEPGYLFQGNNLRLNFLAEVGQFRNIAEGVVADAGWAWGAQFGDLNNDGWTDLFVANGFISADRKRDYWYGMSKIAGAKWDIFEDARNWPPIGTASLSGYEPSRVLVNRGTGGMTDVAAAVGVRDEYDGRGVAVADLFNRGSLDVIVANQNGPALVYRNSVASDRHWIAFKLVGTRSNRSAIGAEVLVEFGEHKQRKVIDGGMGFASQNDRRVHVGLGGERRVRRTVIRWPSGTEQVIPNPEADRLHIIVEPER